MVNTALRGAGRYYAWFEATVRSRTLGGALCYGRCLHLGNYFGAIFNDHVSARLSLVHARSLVANRRARFDGDLDLAGRVLHFALDRARDVSVSTREGPLRMNR